jgi:sugar/nucleoside kinase (ribokinase family)
MHDFIAIGDTATDVFIRLLDDSGAVVSGTPDSPDYRISLPFAAKIPYESAVTIAGVGNAPNAVVAAATLGLKSALVARIGDDEAGTETIEALKKRGVDTQFVTPESGKETNYSYILWYGQERTILRKHEDFTYSLPDLGTPTCIYFSSMGSKADDLYDHFATYIEEHPQITFAFQPGGNEIHLGTKLSRFYKRADMYFSNVEEAGAILGLETLGIKELLKRMFELGPKIVVITDGPNGAYAYDGKEMWHVPVYPDGLNAFERTGAGDSFSSTTAVAHILGKDLPTSLMWGAINSASVVQKVGGQAGLLDRATLEDKLAHAPSDFKPVKLD